MAKSPWAALLVAVTEEIKRETKDKPRRQPNGGGVMVYPLVARVMSALTQEEWSTKRAKDMHHSYKDKGAEYLARMVDEVDPRRYRPVVQEVLRGTGVSNNHGAPGDTPEPPIDGQKKASQKPAWEENEAPDIHEDVQKQKLKMRADYFEKGYNKLIEDEATMETFLETIGEAVAAVDPILPIHLPMPTIVLWNRPRVFMPVLSDMHVGEKVDGKKIKGFNEYNFNVLDERLDRWCTTIEEQFQYQRVLGPVEQIYLPMIGDMVTGENIYRGQWMHIETTVMHQIFEGSDRLSGAIMRLSRLGVPITITGVGGNHARMGKRNESDFSNDFLLYKYLEAKLSNQPNITWELDWAFWTTAQFWDWRFYFCHGDNIRGWGGFPWYGQARADANTLMLMLTQGKWHHFFVHGHFHTDMSLQTPIGKRMANGNWIGTTEYGVAGGFGGRPSQKLLIVTEKGGIECDMPIYLDDINADFMNQAAAGQGLGMSIDPSV